MIHLVMDGLKSKNWLGHLIRVMLLMSMSELVKSGSNMMDMMTTVGPDSATQTLSSSTSGLETNDMMENVARTTQDITTVINMATTIATLIETDASYETVGTDVINDHSSPEVSQMTKIALDLTTIVTTPLGDNEQFNTTTVSLTNSRSSSASSTALSWTTDDKSTERQVVTESDKNTEITTTEPSIESITTSILPYSTYSGEHGPSDTNLEASTVMNQHTTSRLQTLNSVTEPFRKNTTVTVTMAGDCRAIRSNKNDFMGAFKRNVVEYFDFLAEEDVVMLAATCGSVVVEMIIFIPVLEMDAFRDDMENDFDFTYKTFTFRVDSVRIQGDPATTVSVGESNDSPANGDFQQTLIFIVIGSVGGAFLLLSLFLLCQYIAQKVVKASKKTYRPSDEPCIKLADFNMAHTYIPRPQSIYSATTRSSFLPYESMDQGYHFSSTIPTPYVYADGDQIREHYREVVEKEPVTPTSRTINDFGRSGIPSWDLPMLEGVVQEGNNGFTLRIDDHKRTTSSTFHSPPEDDIPPPPTSSPPPPPPSVEYHQPSVQRGVEGSSLKSDDGSSHTEQSLGDTKHLIRTQRHQDVGIDNPAADIDNLYF